MKCQTQNNVVLFFQEKLKVKLLTPDRCDRISEYIERYLGTYHLLLALGAYLAIGFGLESDSTDNYQMMTDQILISMIEQKLDILSKNM